MKLAEKLGAVRGVRVVNEAFFNEFTLRLPSPAAPIVDKLVTKGVLAGVPASRLWPDRPALADLLIVAATEANTEADMDLYARALAEVV